MFLVTVAALAMGYAFYLDVRRDAEHRRFLEWLKTERKAHWEALSRADRLLAIRAVEILRRGPLADDSEFNVRYRATRHGRRFGGAMLVGGVSITLLLVGTTFLDWSW